MLSPRHPHVGGVREGPVDGGVLGSELDPGERGWTVARQRVDPAKEAGASPHRNVLRRCPAAREEDEHPSEYQAPGDRQQRERTAPAVMRGIAAVVGAAGRASQRPGRSRLWRVAKSSSAVVHVRSPALMMPSREARCVPEAAQGRQTHEGASRGAPGRPWTRTTLPNPMRVWLIIPTYNEAENIERVARAASSELARLAPGEHRILVVDDNSPDGTGAIADALAAEITEIEVLHRQAKAGLGQAYKAGFARALAGGAELAIEMDADFSHDPRYLADLLHAAGTADLVLGSRYVNGGGVRDWGIVRRLI